MNKFLTAIIAVFAFTLTGCTAAQPNVTESTARPTFSAYQAPVTAENVGNLNHDFWAVATVTEIGEEEFFISQDSVTGNDFPPIYYTPVYVDVTAQVGGAPKTFTLMVHSDFEPKIDISNLSVGDTVIVASFEPITKNGKVLRAARYLGVVESDLGEVASLQAGDQRTFALDVILKKTGLDSVSG